MRIAPLLLLLACRGTAEPVDADNDTFDDTVDCNDADPGVNPGATEVCNGIDDDCSQVIDDNPTDATTWYADSDGDGHGDAATATDACDAPAGHVADATDCDDSNSAVFPSAAEADCTDPVDYNCDGSVGYEDVDGDGHAACADCNDASAAISPDADEACDEVDNDCDGAIDEAGATGSDVFFADTDGDGHGDPANTEIACSAPEGHVANSDDCNDSSADAHPGGVEICDGLDNDCDGTKDTNATDAGLWYGDGDGDGFGSTLVSVSDCSQPAGFVADNSDCDDEDSAANPDATETCDETDNNCDGVVDEGHNKQWFIDYDDDGFGKSSVSIEQCTQPLGFVAADADCDDLDATVNPGASEACNGTDDDCDGAVPADESDGDADSFRVCDGDCEDGDPAVRPDADEIWYDDVDQDCDGQSDFDQDADGHDAALHGGDDTNDTDPDCWEDCQDGMSQAGAGDSCLQILTDYPGSTDATYWVDPTHDGDTSDAVQIACDMANGGWSLVWENTLIDDHDNAQFTVDCDCSNAMYDHDGSQGWLLGVSGCQSANTETHPGLGSHSWRIEFDAVDVGTATEIRHTGSLQPNRGYDWSWCGELVSATPFVNNGEFGSMVWNGTTWEWFARYGTSCPTFDVSNTFGALEAPYMIFGYDGGGPASCDTNNADGGYANNWEVWVR